MSELSLISAEHCHAYVVLLFDNMNSRVFPPGTGVYIKSLNGNECAKLDGKTIKWVDHMKHLRNFLDSTLLDKFDTHSKISAFIGYVNKV